VEGETTKYAYDADERKEPFEIRGLHEQRAQFIKDFEFARRRGDKDTNARPPLFFYETRR
jgi:hypothetical protein